MNQENEDAQVIAAECIRQSEEGNYERSLFRKAGETIQRLLAELEAVGAGGVQPLAPQQATTVPPQKPKLRVGQIWRTRGGGVVEIVSERENSPRQFVCAIRVHARCKFTVTKNGTFYESAQHPNDLIELISDAQEGGEA